MPRIADAELNRLKTEVSVLRLVQSAGITLKKKGADYHGCCPFHDDKTPSLVVSPDNNLWHCLGACQTGGSVIDWVMKHQRVSFKHAIELLRQDVDLSVASEAEVSSTQRHLDVPFSRDQSDQAVLDHVIDFYHETLLQSPEALAYLDKRGLGNLELIKRFRLGYANRTLAYRLPFKANAEGKALREQLQRVGILRQSGHEHLNGSIVVPVFDESGSVVEAYGRKTRDDLRKGTPKHLYLPGPHRGLWNLSSLAVQSEIILCEALIDALTFYHAGYTNVTASYGVEGFTAEHLEAFKQLGTQRVLIAYDRDEAGNAAADKLAKQLQKAGISSYRLHFPKGMDANAYALQVTPANKSLGVVIRSAELLGEAVGREALGVRCEALSPPETSPATDTKIAPETESKSTSLAAEDKTATAEPELAPSPLAADAAPALPAAAVPAPQAAEDQSVPKTTVSEQQIELAFGDRKYRVRGLERNNSYDVLRVNVLVSAGEALHVDTFDLYSAKARQLYAKQAAAELAVEAAAIQRDLGRLLLQLEQLQDEQIQAALKPKQPAEISIPDDEREAALALLQSSNLIERLQTDFAQIGLVGEPTNAVVAYLAAVSRRLTAPLAIIVQSTSAAGKSALMDTVLKLVPEEDRVHYSAMTGQSLFYLGEGDVKHKILAIAEEEGVRQAAYALKLLQSQGELTIASTGKDPQSGKLVTEEYKVEGPVMLFLTTTAIDIDEELLNRCLVLTIDESRAQTRAIQQRQRQARTLEGLLAQNSSAALLRTHQNAQRLLRPLAVVNPWAEQLTFLDERTRTRRDHQKYLTLIDAIALLHQHQREIKRIEHGGQQIDYIEVTKTDIALANQLAHDVLGRSLDELPPQTRRLLRVICDHVQQQMKDQNLRREEVHFSRRDIRQIAGLSDTQTRIHLDRLVEMEYLLARCGRNGSRYVYELLFDGDAEQNHAQLAGLIDIENLPNADTTTASSRDNNPDPAGCLRPAHGGLAPTMQSAKNSNKASSHKASNNLSATGTETAPLRLENNSAGRNHIASSALAASAAHA